MGRSELGGVGGAESGAKFSAGFGGGSRGCGSDLFPFQRGLLEGAAVCERGRFAAYCFGCGGAGRRTRGCGVDYGSDGDFGAWVDEFVSVERGAAYVRDGAG